MTPHSWQYLPSESAADQADVAGCGTTQRVSRGGIRWGRRLGQVRADPGPRALATLAAAVACLSACLLSWPVPVDRVAGAIVPVVYG